MSGTAVTNVPYLSHYKKGVPYFVAKIEAYRNVLTYPLAYAGFSKRGGGRKFENEEDQKKGLHAYLARFPAQI